MKNLKVYKQAVPYIVAGALTFSGSAALGHTPFFVDFGLEESDLVTTVDQNGQVSREYVDSNNSSTGAVEYYSKWKKTDDGYSRSIDYYLPEDYSVKELKKIAKGNTELEPSFSSTETKEVLDDYELANNRESVIATIIENDKKQVFLIEPDYINEVTTAASIAVFLLMCFGIKEVKNISIERKRTRNKK